MASKKKAASSLPNGFEPIKSNVEGFFLIEEGNKVRGILKERVISKGGKFGPHAFYVIDITSGETRVTDKKEIKVCAEGETIGLDEKGWLKSLSRVDFGTEVFVECTGKGVATEKGMNPPWLFNVGKVSQ